MDLTELVDERSIFRKLSEFARILDQKRWDDLSHVFAEGIVFDYGTGEEQAGIAALRDNMTRYLDCCGSTQHLLGSIVVDIEGDKALSKAYVQARHQGVGEHAGKFFDSNGEYIDRWQRSEDGWRIVRRDAIWASQSGDPAVIGLG
jgi:3-phenylpropionate/cinnamic acid dioxygenase small subunit